MVTFYGILDCHEQNVGAASNGNFQVFLHALDSGRDITCYIFGHCYFLHEFLVNYRIFVNNQRLLINLTCRRQIHYPFPEIIIIFCVIQLSGLKTPPIV
jgi:hypothetical protein